MAGLDLAKVVSCSAPYEWTSGAWALGKGYRPGGPPRFHVVAYDFGVKHNILRLFVERGCRLTVVPAETTARRRARSQTGRRVSVERTGRPRAVRLRDTRDRDDRRRRRADVRHLPRPSIARARVRCGDDEDEVRAPRREPSGARPRYRAGADHEPEPRLRRRRRDARPNTRITHVSLFDGSLQGIARTDRPAFGFQGHPEASPGPHDIGYLFDRFVKMMEKK